MSGYDPREITVEQKHFAHAANMLNAINDEKQLGQIYRSEDLTSDPKNLIDFVAYITHDKVVPTEDWANAAVQVRHINSRATGSPSHVFSEFEKRMLASVVKPEAWSEYDKCGYNTKIST
jgi:hypothetical protein